MILRVEVNHKSLYGCPPGTITHKNKVRSCGYWKNSVVKKVVVTISGCPGIKSFDFKSVFV